MFPITKNEESMFHIGVFEFIALAILAILAVAVTGVIIVVRLVSRRGNPASSEAEMNDVERGIGGS